MGQDNAWRGTTSNYPHSHGAAATAATQDNARHGQHQKDIVNSVLINNLKEKVASTRVGTVATTAQKEVDRTTQGEGQ